MKTIRSLLLVGLLAVCALSTGCASRTIEAATTQLKVTTEEGRSVSLSFPKELTAEGLSVSVDASTGIYTLTAKKITTASAGVIDAAGSAQTNAINALAGALQSATAAAAKGAATAVVP